MGREVKSVRVIYRDGGQWEYAGSALNHAPPADRIALARELLAGTEHRVQALKPPCVVYDCRATEGLGGSWGCGFPDQRCALRQKSEMDAADEGGALFARRAAMLGDEG